MKKSSWLPAQLMIVLIILLAVGCKDSSLHAASAYQSLPNDSTPYQVSVEVDLGSIFPVNKRLLGNNTQWVDRGDELLKEGTAELSPSMLDKVLELKPTVLRYPGGSLADLYHWENGMGEVQNRKKSRRFHGNGEDTILFGTKEFLTLCQLIGAEPILTANIVTAPPAETARWLKKINVERLNSDKGELLPKVGFMELGNEPYLIDDNQKELALTAKQYADKANKLIAALREVDPSVKLGVPLRSDDFDGMPVTPMPGFNVEVLGAIEGPIDFVALHNTYFPFLWGDIPSNKEQTYLAAMAAVNVVSKDLDRTRKQLKKYRKESHIPLAITEMNSMFSIGRGESDEYIQTLTGAMYIADLLGLFAQEPDILMANFWSLTGNWQFGAIDQAGNERPAFKVLSKFHKMLDGKHVKTSVKGPSFDIIQTGLLSAQKEVDYLSALGSVVEGDAGKNELRLWVINKHPVRVGDLFVNLDGGSLDSAFVIETLTTKDYFSVAQSKSMEWEKTTFTALSEVGSIRLAPHSINLITVEL